MARPGQGANISQTDVPVDDDVVSDREGSPPYSRSPISDRCKGWLSRCSGLRIPYRQSKDEIDHPHADINNTGGRNGGSITAALFLAEFVPETVKWAHLDIAGPAMMAGGWRYSAKGMTGFATRTLARLPKALA